MPGADADKAEIQHETKLQEQALDGISDALDDLEQMSKVQGSFNRTLDLLKHVACLRQPESNCAMLLA